MKNYIEKSNILEEKVRIEEIPALIFRPKDMRGLRPTIFFYHGWSSNKESQKIRAFILASAGYQVIVPDSIYHGQRQALENYDMENASKYFWEVILNNLMEADLLINGAKRYLRVDPDRIALMGHSMGGFTSAGIFGQNTKIKTAIVVNGSSAWSVFNHGLSDLFPNPELLDELEEILRDVDPLNLIDELKDRPLLILHGEEDKVVPILGQELFYQQIYPLYEDKEKIKFEKYPNLNHHMTTAMMEESLLWLDKHL